MDEEDEVSVSASVYTSDPQQVARAAEVLGRAIAGLALEGINANLSITPLKNVRGD